MLEANLSFLFRDNEVPVTYTSSVPADHAIKALQSEAFTNWVLNASRIRGNKKLQIHSVELQSVDMFGPHRVGFIKLNSHCTLTDGKAEHEHRLPGICFLRGSSVGILVKLHCVDDGKDYSLLVDQPRIPIGEASCLELPAGMIDPGSGSIGGVAAKEMKEECDLDIHEKDLIDLTQLAYGRETAGMCPSPGGCDEFIRLCYFERNVTMKELDAMRGRLGGLEEEGEIITLRVVKFDEIWQTCSDAKALCALLLHKNLAETGKLDPLITLYNGHRMPSQAFGMYKVEAEDCKQVVLEAIAAGYRHFDTASFYGNEEALGSALKESGIPREELFITTKVWNDAQKEGRAAVRESFKKSLALLDCDYIDLFLVHWPVPECHVETYKELELIQQEGKCRSIGISNYSEEDYQELEAAEITVMPAVNQMEVSPAMYRAPTIKFFSDKRIVVSASKSLHRGASLEKKPIVDIAKKYSVTPAQVMLRWGLQKGLATTTKTSSPERMKENRRLFTFTLDKDDIALLDGMTTEEDIANRAELEKARKSSM
jgi:diketogulonate reductase-like aldo/keto reductase